MNLFFTFSASAVEIKKKRSQLLLSFGKSNLACVVVNVLSTTLRHTPSLTETHKCSSEACINEDETAYLRPYLALSFDVFKSDMQNIEKSIAANLNLILCCRKCKNFTVKVSRTFGESLFIEVSSLTL